MLGLINTENEMPQELYSEKLPRLYLKTVMQARQSSIPCKLQNNQSLKRPAKIILIWNIHLHIILISN